MNASYFHLLNHIRSCIFKDEIIVLDLKKDKYITIQEPEAKLFLLLINQPFYKKGNIYVPIIKKSNQEEFDLDKINLAINFLRENKILSEKDYSFPYRSRIHKATEGMQNIDWRLTTALTEKADLKLIIQCYFYLIKVFFILKFKGFFKLINYLQKKAKNGWAIQAKQMDKLIISLNKACAFFPVKVKCLEWSTTLALLAYKKQLKCFLNIGVQNYPFRAHAWVEFNKKVVCDYPELPHSLAVILKEPQEV